MKKFLLLSATIAFILAQLYFRSAANNSTRRPDQPNLKETTHFTAEPIRDFERLFVYLAAIGVVDRGETLLHSPASGSDIHAHFSSTPSGADIRVDGAYMGNTSLDIDLPCCFHDVTISKPGLKPWTGTVRNNGNPAIDVDLRKRANNDAP